MRVADIVMDLEQIAPTRLAEDWDRVGLQTGSFEAEVRKLAAAVGPSPELVRASVDRGVDMLVLHRPLLLGLLQDLVRDNPWNDALCRLIAAGTSVYVMGTAYDIALGGPTDVLADILDLRSSGIPVRPTQSEILFKVAVFTPPEAVDAVRDAMAEAGAGVIGNYSHCSFMTEGTGTFTPLPGAEPYSGEGIGKLAREKELRLEMLVPEPLLNQVIVAMIDAHPYEEVAYDVYLLMNKGTAYGFGRFCELSQPTTLKEAAARIGKQLDAVGVRILGEEAREIQRVALFAGVGDELIEPAYEAGADVLIAGDLGVEGFEKAERLGIAAIDVAVPDLLKPGVEMLYERLKRMYVEQDIEVMLL